MANVKIGAAYIATQEAVNKQNIFKELRHLQQKTLVVTDIMVTKGVINSIIQT